MKIKKQHYTEELWRQFKRKLIAEWSKYKKYGVSVNEIGEGDKMNFAKAVLKDMRKVLSSSNRDIKLIGTHSLYRYFTNDQLPVKADTKTLDVLSKYIGYLSFGNFQQKNLERLANLHSIKSNSNSLSPFKLELPKRKRDWFKFVYGICILLFIIGVCFNIPIFNGPQTSLVLISIIISLFGYSLFLHIERSKYKRYYDAFPRMRKPFSFVHQMNNPVPQSVSPNLEEDVDMFRYFCTHLAIEFSKITNSNCAVCIKFINLDYIETFVRDHYSDSARSLVEMQDNKNQIKHKLSDNTHFRYIFDTEEDDRKLVGDYYLGKDLAVENGYQNSRLNGKKLPPNKGIVNRIKRRIQWSKYLPYRTTLVVPIVPLDTKSLVNVRLEGYLCIDSNKRGVFSEKDAEILLGVADGLYPSIIKFRDRHFPQ